ncbi:MAG: hypothetical protein Q8O95_00240 [bacterium]|nr:hypothetical protein [bacterium]
MSEYPWRGPSRDDLARKERPSSSLGGDSHWHPDEVSAIRARYGNGTLSNVDLLLQIERVIRLHPLFRDLFDQGRVTELLERCPTSEMKELVGLTRNASAEAFGKAYLDLRSKDSQRLILRKFKTIEGDGNRGFQDFLDSLRLSLEDELNSLGISIRTNP